MKDVKTVTFDARACQGALEMPTLGELSEFAANLVRNGDLIWAGFSKDEEERYTIPYIVPAVYNLVLAAIKQYGSPTPAAQSAGQEVIYQIKCTQNGVTFWGDVTRETYEGHELVGDATMRRIAYRVPYAAPVNGGERDTVRMVTDASKPWPDCYQFVDERAADAQQECGSCGYTADPECPICSPKDVADAQQVGGNFESWWETVRDDMIQDTDPRRHAEAAWQAALSSPAKVGRDEREAFKTWKRTVPPCHAEELVFLRQGFAAGWELGRAALSADGGDRKDAKRRADTIDSVLELCKQNMIVQGDDYQLGGHHLAVKISAVIRAASTAKGGAK